MIFDLVNSRACHVGVDVVVVVLVVCAVNFWLDSLSGALPSQGRGLLRGSPSQGLCLCLLHVG